MRHEEALTRAGAIHRLSIVAAPKQRNTKAEKKATRGPLARGVAG
jgi:hypothetical protein